MGSGNASDYQAWCCTQILYTPRDYLQLRVRDSCVAQGSLPPAIWSICSNEYCRPEPLCSTLCEWPWWSWATWESCVPATHPRHAHENLWECRPGVCILKGGKWFSCTLKLRTSGIGKRTCEHVKEGDFLKNSQYLRTDTIASTMVM